MFFSSGYFEHRVRHRTLVDDSVNSAASDRERVHSADLNQLTRNRLHRLGFGRPNLAGSLDQLRQKGSDPSEQFFNPGALASPLGGFGNLGRNTLRGDHQQRVVKRHRQTRDTPVLMLTARTGLKDRLKGFSVGAEDYLCKPFSVREAVLRVRALLRRVDASEGSNGKKVFRIGEEIVLDFSRYSFSKGGSQLRLTPKESCILRHLLERSGQVVRREELLRDVWGDNVFVELGNIEVHIRHLREKIEPDPAKPAHLITVRGVGYRFEN